MATVPTAVLFSMVRPQERFWMIIWIGRAKPVKVLQRTRSFLVAERISRGPTCRETKKHRHVCVSIFVRTLA